MTHPFFYLRRTEGKGRVAEVSEGGGLGKWVAGGWSFLVNVVVVTALIWGMKIIQDQHAAQLEYNAQKHSIYETHFAALDVQVAVLQQRCGGKP